MKKSKIILLIILTFLIAREISSFELNYFRSYYHNNMNSTHNFTINTSNLNGGIFEIDLDALDEYYINFTGLGIEHKKYDKNDNVVSVKIKGFLPSSMLYYVPLVKYMKTNQTFSFHCIQRIKLNGEHHVINVNGTIKLASELKIYGICAGKTAKRDFHNQIKEKVQQFIINTISDKINELKE